MAGSNNHNQKHESSAFGEGIVRAGSREVRVKFNNRALAEAEQQMGKSVIGVAQGYAAGDSGVTELAHLLRAGMQAARRANRERGRPVTLNDAYTVLDKAGFAEVANVVMSAVGDVLGYDPNAPAPEEDDESSSVVDGEYDDYPTGLPDPNA